MAKTQKIKVGIVGENIKNDSEALKILLSSVTRANVNLSVYPKKFDGGQLDGEKFFRTLEIEAESLDWVILVRDLDGLISETKKLKLREEWFNKANKQAAKKGIFFLAIYEMEALILADIDNFNKYYGLEKKPVGNPMAKEKPKELLEKLTEKTQKGKYTESDALKIFPTLDIKTIYKNHKGEYSFQSFADELQDKKLISIK
jgi:hypothetical protein